MPDINDLGLAPEPVGEIDYNAPESGAFPPQLPVGVYNFRFELEDDPWGTVEIGDPDNPTAPKKKYLQVAYKAVTTVQTPEHPEGEEKELRFQRVNFYKHPKMNNSSGGDLIRGLGLRIEGGLTPQVIADNLKAVAGRATFEGEVGWRAYCKSHEIEISTNARKKRIAKGEQIQWPKDANGHFVDMAECPSCHQKMYGNAEIVRIKLPTEAGQQPQAGGVAA